jgi:hypothetical protein
MPPSPASWHDALKEALRWRATICRRCTRIVRTVPPSPAASTSVRLRPARPAAASAPGSVGRGLAAPLGLARVELRGAVFPVGGHDALDPVLLDLRGDEDSAMAETLGVGADFLLG